MEPYCADAAADVFAAAIDTFNCLLGQLADPQTAPSIKIVHPLIRRMAAPSSYGHGQRSSQDKRYDLEARQITDLWTRPLPSGRLAAEGGEQ